MAIETMGYEEQEEARRLRLAEVGTLSPCPLCGVARVQRSDYIRCNRCGKNWLEGEDLTKDPRESRKRKGVATLSMIKTQEKPIGAP